MDIGVGLPSTIPGITARQVLDWARTAEQAGFSSLGTLDRVVYGNLETIPTLAAAAAVTERIGLTTAIMIGPYRGNGTLLAKQLATVDNFAAGRLTLGIAVGARPDDFEATASPFGERGRQFDAQLAELRAVWAGEERGFAGAVGPTPVQAGGPPLLIGGTAPAAYRRMTEHGAGWIAGGGGPDAFAQGAEQARQAWQEAGRDGRPRLVAITYVSLGDDAEAHARSYLGDYYAFAGEYAERVAAGALTSPQQVADAVGAFAEHGCDELILFPCNPDVGQVDLIASAARK
ncbi:LLM class flavin-dependent oxidoreductase [Labedaea rhizosphaerae]|uniref:Alkanesulfonate monooxygenase SsuD/methylene tetrahydromethanopterin reductase-like flavin-dependent oxidoreductase (Luciferase family) n=1 Tax=Labedaea rhizosphaerae TaxID=598644 RepID=A0A4R6SFE0_LABRH|nr:LLM class flavin-dependent oxidoreductase [Labedaea rhizosphaerae]TDQ00284.1 alkanesulfonate monooxygenase SsuD/methylene tetrahydromethanopterin reductase-like flavin-dependent oxidoreductase (luciferase family) [Labedaea rhizosphaerae]